MALFTTFITTPIVTAIYKPARRHSAYKHRTIQRSNPITELRILACFHSTRNIPTMINLLESSRGTQSRGLIIYAMHLMKLSERSSAINMVNKARRNGLPFWNKKRPDTDDMVVAFKAYKQLSYVTIRPMIAISHLSSIHEDICTSAEQKRAAIILLPFHKHQRLDGAMEPLGHSFHHVNQLVLSNAPCSVGILIDRGLGGTTQISASDVSFTVVALFFGGRDDREALAYGARIAEHPGIQLTVLRFVAVAGKSLMGSNGENIGISMEADERTADDKCIAEFLRKTAVDNESISFEEKEVGSTEDIVTVVKTMNRCNLCLAGRMPPVDPLIDWTDCPELGPVGCFLASSEFSTMASVLVLQQYDPTANLLPPVEEVAEIHDVPDTPATPSDKGFE